MDLIAFTIGRIADGGIYCKWFFAAMWKEGNQAARAGIGAMRKGPQKIVGISLALEPIPPIPIKMKRDEQQSSPLLARVRKIGGQVKGVGKMIEDNRECPDILHTISSIHSALRGLEALLLEDHVRHCVCDATGDPERLERRLEEIISLYKRRLA